jgi:hypothetical protein
MCRNIKPLYNFEPPATDDEIRAAAIQFVRKISGFSKPSSNNAKVFEIAIKEITAISKKMLNSLVTNAPPKNREDARKKLAKRNKHRFSRAEIITET